MSTLSSYGLHSIAQAPPAWRHVAVHYTLLPTAELLGIFNAAVTNTMQFVEASQLGMKLW